MLNYEIGTHWYLAEYLPYDADLIDSYTSTYRNHLIFDIQNGWPAVANAEEVAGGHHLAGHPDQEIGHWFTISGYENNGDQTDYMDSATSVWPSVTGWNTLFDSRTLVIIVTDRGYVW